MKKYEVQCRCVATLGLTKTVIVEAENEKDAEEKAEEHLDEYFCEDMDLLYDPREWDDIEITAEEVEEVES